MINDFFSSIATITKHGKAKEGSYYPAIESFFDTYAKSKDLPESYATTLGEGIKKKDFTMYPDIEVYKDQLHSIGYVEVKDPQTIDISALPDPDQERFDRYKENLSNVILTNGIAFELYRDGRLVDKATIADFPDGTFLKDGETHLTRHKD